MEGRECTRCQLSSFALFRCSSTSARRGRRCPAAALVENHPCRLQRAVRARCGVRLKRRGAQGSWPASAASLVNTSGASCLSVANAVSEASYAPGHGPEHRRAAGAKRRPLHPHAGPRPDSPLPPRHFACPSMHRVSATGRSEPPTSGSYPALSLHRSRRCRSLQVAGNRSDSGLLQIRQTMFLESKASDQTCSVPTGGWRIRSGRTSQGGPTSLIPTDQM